MGQLAMATTSHLPSYSWEDYILSECNRHAHDIIMRYPHWPGKILSLVGDEGSGKTHLAHMVSEAFHLPIISQQRLSESSSSQLLDEVDGIILDDADAMTGEEQLFHLINYVREQHKSLLFCSRAPLATCDWRWADIRSRVAVIPIVALDPPDDVLLSAVITKHFADRQIKVQREVVEFMAKRVERSFQVVSNVVATLDYQALRQQRPITIPMVRNFLEEEAI